MIYEKIKAYCSEHDISISEFEKKCDIGNGTVGRWKDNASKPTLHSLEKIEKATEIPVSKWISSN